MTENQPLVSVIVTSLDRPDYLRGACESILGGEFRNVEVFICDDASDSQQAREAAQRIAEADDRVTVLQNERRLGQFRSISNALERMRGAYFAILNDDDTWEPRFLSKLIPPLEEDPDLVAAFCDHWAIDDAGQVKAEVSDELTRRYHRADLEPGRHEDSGLLGFGLSAFPTVVASVFRTSSVDLDAYLGAAMDPIGFYDLWLQACSLGDRCPVWYEPERLSSYRQHEGQLSSRPSSALGRAKAWIFEEALAGERFTQSQAAIFRQLSKTHYALGMTYLRSERPRVARSYLWRALSQAPRRRTLIALALTFDLWPLARLRRRLST
jgi:glycosyltransferase involved in cell wall biosynthesis